MTWYWWIIAYFVVGVVVSMAVFYVTALKFREPFFDEDEPLQVAVAIGLWWLLLIGVLAEYANPYKWLRKRADRIKEAHDAAKKD